MAATTAGDTLHCCVHQPQVFPWQGSRWAATVVHLRVPHELVVLGYLCESREKAEAQLAAARREHPETDVADECVRELGVAVLREINPALVHSVRLLDTRPCFDAVYNVDEQWTLPDLELYVDITQGRLAGTLSSLRVGFAPHGLWVATEGLLRLLQRLHPQATTASCASLMLWSSRVGVATCGQFPSPPTGFRELCGSLPSCALSVRNTVFSFTRPRPEWSR